VGPPAKAASREEDDLAVAYSSLDCIALLWAKVGRAKPEEMVHYHPLVCHMVDTAMVVQCLWSDVMSIRFRSQMASLLGGFDQARAILSFLAACHDLGKASPEFVGQWPAARVALSEASYPFPSEAVIQHPGIVPHSIITAIVLPQQFQRDGVPEVFSELIGVALGGHHGLFPSSEKVERTPIAFHRDAERAAVWQQLRSGVYDRVKAVIGADLTTAKWEAISRCPWFVTKLAGLTSVSDWIASSEDHFPYAMVTLGQSLDLELYTKEALARARAALDSLGWTGWSPSDRVYSFLELFRREPRPLQKAVADLAESELDSPSLVLIEAPMGEGKTEAALYLHDWLQARVGQRGLYVALPTQATSNSMLPRVAEYLRRRYPGEKVNLHLMHANAALDHNYEALSMAGIDDEEEGELAQVVAEEWFAPKKRSLLAPFGVGTVDQALLSVLWVKHGFVRLFGLSDKVVVIDEVHAYDVYTSELVCGLVRWLRELGASVLLLSATLPSQRRRNLVSAYNEGREIDIDHMEASYPRITWVSQFGSSGSLSFRARDQKPISVRKMGSDIERVARALIQSVSQGGCAAWICNTVAKSQAVYRMLKPMCENTGIRLELFHARYPFDERMAREDRAVSEFGKRSLLVGKPEYYPRPERAILVATQVIEQSLDLDFDLMVSEAAPIDLILQRSGRMHRHKRDNRPPHLQEPTLWIVEPPIDDKGIPDFSTDSYVYSEYILQKSWYVLSEFETIQIPEDIEPLIERVYTSPITDWRDSLSTAQMSALAEAERKDEEQRLRDAYLARAKLLQDPDPDLMFLDDGRHDLFEDDSDAGQKLQAATRLARPSVQVVCSHRLRDGRLSLDAGGEYVIDKSSCPSLEDARRLLARSVTLTRPSVVTALLREPVPSGWRRNALLRRHRLVGFEEGKTEIGGWTVRLDEELGIVIER
jgi:CRISPR-associated endonuclease/helicase Cas3